MDMASLIAVGGFAGYLTLVVLGIRILAGKPPALIAVAGAFLGYILCLAAAVLSPFRVSFWHMSGIYWFLSLCYLVLFGAAYKSISLRILSDLLGQPNRSAIYETVLQRYVERESFHVRLRLIVTQRYANLTDARYALTAKGRRLATAVYRLQQLFRIEKSG